MNNEIIKGQLSEWVKLIRKDGEISSMQNIDSFIAMELSVMFLKLAEQMPAHALALISKEIEETKKSIELSRVMANM